MTIDPRDAWDLVETADRKGLHLVCSFGWNFLPMLRDAKRLVEERGIGEVEHLVVHMASHTRELLSKILVEEEKHVDWLETQQETIKQIGLERYLSEQLK